MKENRKEIKRKKAYQVESVVILLQEPLSGRLVFTFAQWHPTPVLLPGKSHGQRSLVGCSPWGH